MENERVAYHACPLCQSAEIYPLATVDCTGHAMWHEPLEPSITWVQCGECRHIFTDGYFTPEAFEVLYSTVPDEASVGTNAEFQPTHFGNHGGARGRQNRLAKQPIVARRRLR